VEFSIGGREGQLGWEFLSRQSKNVRFIKNESRFSFNKILEENLNERGYYHIAVTHIVAFIDKTYNMLYINISCLTSF